MQGLKGCSVYGLGNVMFRNNISLLEILKKPEHEAPVMVFV